MQIIPISDLENTADVERRCAAEDGPMFVTKNGCPRLVVMDIDFFERTMGKTCEAKMVRTGIDDLKAGRTIDGPEAFRKIREKYGF